MKNDRPNSDQPASVTLAERVRAMFAIAIQPPPAGDCPEPEEIQLAHERLLDPARERAVEAHLAACHRCFELWAGLVDLAPGPASPRRARGRSWTSRLRPAPLAGATVAIFAVALGVGMFLGRFGVPTALPPYEISVFDQLSDRGTTPADNTVTVSVGTRLELVLVPDVAVGEPVAVRVLVGAGERIETVDFPTVEITAAGAVSLSGDVGVDLVLPGDGERLYVVVSYRERLPQTRETVERLETDGVVHTADWSGWSFDLQFSD